MTQVSLSTLLKKAKTFKYRIYCGMDGVLTWFEHAISELTKKVYRIDYNFEQFKAIAGSEDNAWQIIGQQDNFWYMRWQPGGQELWEKLRWYYPTILTTPGGDIEKCKQEKMRWVHDNLGPDVQVIFAENGKGKFADKNSILIDDMESNLKDWRKAGGIAIKHESPEKTIELLRNIIIKKNKQLNKAGTFSGYKLHKRRKFMGMNVSVENRAGSYRHWKDDQGNEGKTKMLYDYGYIRGTEGRDGDHVDVFLGKNENAPYAFVVHQNRLDTGAYDEDKVMLGFDTAEAAKKAYLKHYDSLKFFGGMKALPIEQFKERVYKTLHSKKKSLKSEIHKAFAESRVRIIRRAV